MNRNRDRNTNTNRHRNSFSYRNSVVQNGYLVFGGGVGCAAGPPCLRGM